MSMGNTLRNDLLKLYFNATPTANVADNAASSPITNIQVSFHTANPGNGGNQTTNEATYTGYSRTAVARNSGGWTVSTNSVSPAAAITGPTITGGSPAIMTHFGLGRASSGAGTLDFFGIIGTNQGGFTALASNDTFTVPGVTGVSTGDQIGFYAINGESLPTGVTEGTLYFVKTISGSAITISATNGGSTIDITGDGEGYCVKCTPLTLTAPTGVPQLTTGTTITLA